MSEPIRILYVHGYLGSGNGHSSRLIQQEFALRGVPCELDAPDFPVTKPEEMKKQINHLIDGKRYDYIVASSLGAFYCMQISGIQKILVNIALPENLERIKESDPGQHPGLTAKFFAEINKEKEAFFSEILDANFIQETYVIYGTKDSIASNEKFLRRYYTDGSRVFHIDMEHKLDENGASTVFNII